MRRIDCDVWMLRLDEIDEEQVAGFLVPEEQSRLKRLRNRGDRLRHAGGRSLLRAAVAERAGVEPGSVHVASRCVLCGSSEHGKPYLEAREEYVSIAHSSNLVLVAITEVAPVGVDVEKRDSGIEVDLIAGYIVVPDEPAPVGPTEFYRTWCRKEAVVKACGVGISVPLRDVRVTAPDQEAGLVSFPKLNEPVTLCDIDLSHAHTDYAAALAVLADGSLAPRLRDGTSLIHTLTRGGIS
ncbi:4'-phosphopantetheinyl transferase family protein [Nocardia sp. 004]|uniref:4'-phosphopantetheinyl transferase family protein n=1 Tax=Nocardia sp. 004 TaxID=3385978 RepID=UPI0039A1684C